MKKTIQEWLIKVLVPIIIEEILKKLKDILDGDLKNDEV